MKRNLMFALHAQPLVLPLQTGDLRRVVRRRQRRLRCGAPRRRRRLSPGPTQLHPAAQNRIAQAKFLGHRADRAAARSHQIDRLPFIVVRKRPTLTSFYSTPPGSSSLLQVSINSEEVHPGHDTVAIADRSCPSRKDATETGGCPPL